MVSSINTTHSERHPISLQETNNVPLNSAKEDDDGSHVSSSVVADSVTEESKELELHTLEELEAAYNDKYADYERIRKVVKGWMLAFEEAFGRAPDANDRLGEQIMFRNFNDAKNDMDEALAALEKVRNEEVVHVVAPVDESESKFEGVAGIVDGGVSQLTLDDGMFAPFLLNSTDLSMRSTRTCTHPDMYMTVIWGVVHIWW